MAKYNFLRDEQDLKFCVAPIMIKTGRLLRRGLNMRVGKTVGGIHVCELIEDLWW